MNGKRVKRSDSRKRLSANKILTQEWHPTLNGSLTPQQVAPYSLKKVWWICSQGHAWQAMISNRSQGTGCPYCSGRAATQDNCMVVTHPSLAREWHSSRNGTMTPRKVTAGSGKKVWWVCQKGHEWEARVLSRSRGSQCPYCSGHRVTLDTCLATVSPGLAREWHPHPNGALTPRDITPHSGRKVWWICQQGHEWEALISNRSQGTGCPYCSGRLATGDHSLATANPSLAGEWHPTRNGEVTPADVTPYSGKKVWWRCARGHEYQARVAIRNSQGTGCPYCSGRRAHPHHCLQTSCPPLGPGVAP